MYLVQINNGMYVNIASCHNINKPQCRPYFLILNKVQFMEIFASPLITFSNLNMLCS